MPTLSNCAPILAVKNLAQAVHFYQESLGFQVAMETNDPMPYAIMMRNDVGVHLTVDDARCGKGALYSMVDDVDALHSEFAAKGVRITEPPDDRVYGMRDMYIHDDCGNLLGFGQMLSR